MAPIKIIMADVMRMRKLLMLLTSVWVKIQLNWQECLWHAPIKNHNGGYYAHAQTSNAYNFCLSWNSIKFIRTFI